MPAEQMPFGLVQGGPLGDAYRAIDARLRLAFPEQGGSPMGAGKFNHRYTPPKMGDKVWAKLTTTMPLIGLGFTGWVPDKQAGRVFRGDAGFIVFLLTRNARIDWQMVGDKASPGLAAMISVCAAFLHGWNVQLSGGPKLGLCSVTQVNAVDPASWVGDDTAIAAVEIVVADLELRDPAMDAGLPDFLKLGVTWGFGTDPEAEDVLNVRGGS